MHMLTHANIYKYKCEQCDYVTNRWADFRRHTPIHTKSKPNQCTYCGYTCVRYARLRDHMLVHRGKVDATNDPILSKIEKDILYCSLCDYVTVLPSQMKKHEKAHNNRGFHCQQCDFITPKVSLLRSHMREAHQEVKPQLPQVTTYVPTQPAYQDVQQTHQAYQQPPQQHTYQIIHQQPDGQQVVTFSNSPGVLQSLEPNTSYFQNQGQAQEVYTYQQPMIQTTNNGQWDQVHIDGQLGNVSEIVYNQGTENIIVTVVDEQHNADISGEVQTYQIIAHDPSQLDPNHTVLSQQIIQTQEFQQPHEIQHVVHSQEIQQVPVPQSQDYEQIAPCQDIQQITHSQNLQQVVQSQGLQEVVSQELQVSQAEELHQVSLVQPIHQAPQVQEIHQVHHEDHSVSQAQVVQTVQAVQVSQNQELQQHAAFSQNGKDETLQAQAIAQEYTQNQNVQEHTNLETHAQQETPAEEKVESQDAGVDEETWAETEEDPDMKRPSVLPVLVEGPDDALTSMSDDERKVENKKDLDDPDWQPKSKVPRNHSKSKRFHCELCNFSCDYKSTFKVHMKKHESAKNYKCAYCNFKCDQMSRMKNHLVCHSNVTMHTCEICGESCKSKKAYMMHLKSHTPGGSGLFQCTLCEYQCKSFPGLQAHMDKHTGENRFACDKCDERFPTSYKLKKHKVIHGEKMFQCPHCSYTCVLKQLMETHILQHTMDQFPFRCDQCDAKYKKKDSLKIHIMSRHENKHRFQCSLCNYAGNRYADFREHLLTHSGVKPKQCPVCNYSCLRDGQLKKHILTHTRGTTGKSHKTTKIYRCAFCEFTSTRLPRLKAHVGKVHLNLPDNVIVTLDVTQFTEEKKYK